MVVGLLCAIASPSAWSDRAWNESQHGRRVPHTTRSVSAWPARAWNESQHGRRATQDHIISLSMIRQSIVGLFTTIACASAQSDRAMQGVPAWLWGYSGP